MEWMEMKVRKIEQIVNLSPKAIEIYGEGLTLLASIPPSGRSAKVYVEREEIELLECDEFAGPIPVVRTIMHASGIPEPQEGVVYVVSSLIAQAAQRDDVFSPDTLPGGPIKEYGGRGVRGIRALQLWE